MKEPVIRPAFSLVYSVLLNAVDLQRSEVRAASGGPQGSQLLQTGFAKMLRRGRGTWPNPAGCTKSLMFKRLLQGEAFFDMIILWLVNM